MKESGLAGFTAEAGLQKDSLIKRIGRAVCHVLEFGDVDISTPPTVEGSFKGNLVFDEEGNLIPYVGGDGIF